MRWLLAFRRSCTSERWEQGVRALLALNTGVLGLFDAYAQNGVEFEMHRSGLLLVATTNEGLDSYTTLFRDLLRSGFEGEIVELGTRDACALEPALSETAIFGAVRAVDDRYRDYPLDTGMIGA